MPTKDKNDKTDKTDDDKPSVEERLDAIEKIVGLTRPTSAAEHLAERGMPEHGGTGQGNREQV